jgi:hypothetical protein
MKRKLFQILDSIEKEIQDPLDSEQSQLTRIVSTDFGLSCKGPIERWYVQPKSILRRFVDELKRPFSPHPDFAYSIEQNKGVTNMVVLSSLGNDRVNMEIRSILLRYKAKGEITFDFYDLTHKPQQQTFMQRYFLEQI